MPSFTINVDDPLTAVKVLLNNGNLFNSEQITELHRIISTDLDIAIRYPISCNALSISEHAFFEQIISRSAKHSFIYADEVLMGPFIEGEVAMMGDSRIWVDYQLMCAELAPEYATDRGWALPEDFAPATWTVY